MSEENTIPESLLVKLYDRTGTKEGFFKGFCLFHIDDEGNVVKREKYDKPASRIAIESVMEDTFEIELDD